MAHRPDHKISEIRYTITLAGRDSVSPALTYEEAIAMYQMGFRFSIFEPEQGDYRLSIPYSVVRLIDRDALMFIQDV